MSPSYLLGVRQNYPFRNGILEDDMSFKLIKFNNATKQTDTSVVDGSYNVARRGVATVSTPINPSALLPTPAYGTRLRAIGFWHDHCARTFVVKLIDDLRVACRTYLLCLDAANLLRRLIERLTDNHFSIRKLFLHQGRRFMRQIIDSIARLSQHLGLASLKLFPSARTFQHLRLPLLNRSQVLVAPLNRRLSLASADEQRLLPIRGGNKRVDAEINPNRNFHHLRLISHFAGEENMAHAQSNFHQSTWKFNAAWNLDEQLAAHSVRQGVATIGLNSHRLIRIDDIPVFNQPPRIAGFRVAIFSQLACGVHRLAKLANDLLNRLRVQARITTFSPPLPATFAGPLHLTAANTSMAKHYIIPQTRRFSTRRRERLPLSLSSWHPTDFDGLIGHVIKSYRVVYSNAKAFHGLSAIGLISPRMNPGALRPVW